TVEVSGMPQAGDSFQIKPSENTSLFATIQDMVNNLNLPFTTAVEKAATVSENNQLMAQIDSALKNITNIISNLGSRSNQVVSAQESNQDMIDASTITLKYLSEAPPTTVATQFNLQLVSLEAAQLSFTRVQNLSIFKYI
ncbi:MAG: flagellar biosynthesis protein FlgL, partial [Legionella sp.]|nr:flagellar biosynthesis protein FlgL [Legionella sp.]